MHRACADAFDIVLEFFDLTAGASLICDVTLQERSLSADLLLSSLGLSMIDF